MSAPVTQNTFDGTAPPTNVMVAPAPSVMSLIRTQKSD